MLSPLASIRAIVRALRSARHLGQTPTAIVVGPALSNALQDEELEPYWSTPERNSLFDLPVEVDLQLEGWALKVADERGSNLIPGQSKPTERPLQQRELRFETDLVVRVYYGGTMLRAVAANMSSGGAYLSVRGPLDVNAQVTILCQPLSLRARVAWSSRLASGVQFATPLRDEDLQALRCSIDPGADVQNPET